MLPIGYGDGVRRALSNNAEVLSAAAATRWSAPSRWTTSRSTSGPRPAVEPGAEAVLIGAQGGERILAEELAERLATINYEVTCGISPRVPRELAGAR